MDNQIPEKGTPANVKLMIQSARILKSMKFYIKTTNYI